MGLSGIINMACRGKNRPKSPRPQVGAQVGMFECRVATEACKCLKGFVFVVPMQELPKPTHLNLSVEQVRPGTRVPKPTSCTRQPSLRGGHVVVAVNARICHSPTQLLRVLE